MGFSKALTLALLPLIANAAIVATPALSAIAAPAAVTPPALLPDPIVVTNPTETADPVFVAVAAPGAAVAPSSPDSVGAFNYLGCYVDLNNQKRSLSDGATYDTAMTLELCAKNCVGFEYFGTEYNAECYCGYTLSASLKAPETDCSNACGGNPSQLCGNNDRLSVYKSKVHVPPPPPPVHAQRVNGFAWQSCYTEALQTGTERTLKDKTYVGSGMTVESCTSFCAGSTYAGLEYGSECYCGSVISSDAAPAPVEDCYQRCAGNSTEFCGGPNRLDLYKTLAPPAYNMVGCYLEPKGAHAMPLLVSNKSVTPELCLAVVKSLAAKPVPTVYPYFGVENKKECYGASSLNFGGSPITSVAGKKACTKTCIGSAKGSPTDSAKCGGSKMFNLYVKNGAALPSAAVTKST